MRFVSGDDQLEVRLGQFDLDKLQAKQAGGCESSLWIFQCRQRDIVGSGINLDPFLCEEGHS